MKISQVSSLKSQVSSLKSQVSRLILCLVVSFSVFFQGCQKELTHPNLSIIPSVRQVSTISVADAKKWYEQQYGNAPRSFSSQDSVLFTPEINWLDALNSFSTNGDEFVSVPCNLAVTNRSNILFRLLVKREVNGDFSGRYLVYIPEATSNTATLSHYNLQTFSGQVIYTDIHGKLINGYKILNGVVTDSLAVRTSDGRDLSVRLCSSIEICPTPIDIPLTGRCATVSICTAAPSGGTGVSGYPQGNGEAGGWGDNTRPNQSGTWGSNQPPIDAEMVTFYKFRLVGRGIMTLAQFTSLVQNNPDVIRDISNYLDGAGYNPEAKKIASLHTTLLINDTNYSNRGVGSVANVWNKYKSAGFTFDEFEDFYQNSPNFNIINDFLSKYNSSEDAKKIIKLHSKLFKEDADYANETLQAGKIPVPVILWILKAGGETLVDAAIDVAFGYLTGVPPSIGDHLMSFGTNLIGTGETAQALKIAKYLAKIADIANAIRHIPGGNILADKVVTFGSKLIDVVRSIDLSNVTTAKNRLRGAFDDLVGAAYETRVAASVLGNVKAVAIRGSALASHLGLTTQQLNDIAARLGRSVNDIEVDLIEEVGGKISISECKAIQVVDTYANYAYKQKLLAQAAFAKEVANTTGKNVSITLYVMEMAENLKGDFISRVAQLGVTLKIVVTP